MSLLTSRTGDLAFYGDIRMPKGTTMEPMSNHLRMPDGTTVNALNREEVVQAVKDFEQRLYRKEREPHEFFAFCQAQFPELIETFRRLEVVKAQFAKFVGKAES